MKTIKKHITVFEHEILHANEEGQGLSSKQLKALEVFHGDKGIPYYTLVRNGIKFCEYVGVIQVGNLTIEVLPKADKGQSDNNAKTKWRELLIGMLRSIGSFDVYAPSSSALKIKTNSILELYFELFIKEVEYLLHSGLVKKYRNREGNSTALKGSLLFSKQIQQNLTHQERFYVRSTVYDVEHTLHYILYKTIKLLKQINTNADLHTRIGTLQLYFPEMPDLNISEATFSKIVYNRKTQSYKNAIEIARLLLLHNHPDLMTGRNNVLALMFDMNMLWERFVYASIRKHVDDGFSIESHTSKYFWQPEKGKKSKMIPDIVINKGRKDCAVLDTKWKNLDGTNPSPDDLRQMYVYQKYYEANKVALIHPGNESKNRCGRFLDPKTGEKTDMECSLMPIVVENSIKQWQQIIYNRFHDWINLTN